MEISKRLFFEEKAAILAEYGLLIFFIAAAAVTAVFIFGESVLALYESFDLSIFD